ncbi:serine hydrolase domain-containing protein [Nocardioides aequoreus]|uniref:serine hydrolase domain-containing protein n=1 Tax=Nocardioides aequoreus TaxID=397278 RepID=UPI00068E87B7|nr:serine hydrolase domain-containing protein [Nocardioides aequoreus]
MTPASDAVGAEQTGLSSVRFVDPHHDASRPHATVAATTARPLPRAVAPLEAVVHGAGRSWSLPEWVRGTHTTSLLALDRGTVVHEWYAEGVGPGSLLLGASMSKSALAHLVAVAVGAGALRLDDGVVDHVPELRGSGYDGCAVAHVLTMTTGTAWVEDHRDAAGPASRLLASFFAGESSRARLAAVAPAEPPGTRWCYSTADSQVLDWVRERATGATYAEALGTLWRQLGCVRDAVVAVDGEGVALAGGGLAACAEDWLRLAALQLDGTAYDARVLPAGWVEAASAAAYPFTAPGRLPSTITTHAGFGRHWWPLTADGRRVVADGSRGQLGYVDRDLGVAVLKTSLWPYDDPWVDRQQRDLSYLGLPLVATAARLSTRSTPEQKEATS